ncbi:hypothetical protein IV203_016459 [Nitzschia inconspicua]|uniref:G-protein coupled receptors family 2 profile 2 domain-containing protein n=1 Tax=Nitzschia inconspicua TaxID=303405 RepID=A0A9K3KR81_9STRA|nr:hypothetical protein IV203_016459 [Nitzschia inconspicua]
MNPSENENFLRDGDPSIKSSEPSPSLPQDFESYSYSQDAFLTIAPKITSVFSIVGCTWIVIEVVYSFDKRHNVYHGIIAAMAFYCILVSIWYFVADWAAESACRAQGYFVQLSLAPMLYFAMLFLYYVLVITYSIPEKQLTSNKNLKLRCKWLRLNWQQIFHIFPSVVSVATASISLPLDLYHPSHSTTWCWVAMPSTSEEVDRNFQQIFAFQWGFYLAPCWISFGVMVVTLFMVFRGVETQEKRMKKYISASANVKGTTSLPMTPLKSSTNHSRNDSTSVCSLSLSTVLPDALPNPPSSSNPAPNRAQVRSIPSNESYGKPLLLSRFREHIFRTQDFWDHRPRTRQVLVQCLCYVSAFFWSNIFLTVNEIILWNQGVYSSVPYALVALQCSYQPLLGFFIFLAYRRPFYMRMRRQGLSRGQALWCSLKWSHNPSDRPGLRNSLNRKQLVSRSVAAAFKSERGWATKDHSRQRWSGTEEHHDQELRLSAKRSNIRRIRTLTQHLWPISSTDSIHSSDDVPEIRYSIGRRSQSVDGVLETDGHATAIESIMASRKLASTGHDPFETSEGCSARDSHETFVLMRDGSTHRLDCHKEESIEMDELMPASQETDERSMSLEDLINASSGGESDSELNHGDGNNGDLEAQHSTGTHSRRFFNFYGGSETKEDFELIKQCSQTYQDLVLMDIFPEADGEMEGKWRSIEARVRRYEKTKHDKHKLNMSVPVMSERHFASNPRIQSPQESSGGIHSRNDKGMLRYAWAKNPLFKISGRQNRESRFHERSNRASTVSSSDGSGFEKVVPTRISSGGYFCSPSRNQASQNFVLKLEKEKSRQEMLQEISSRRILSRQSAEEEELRQMVNTVTQNKTLGSSDENTGKSSNQLFDVRSDLKETSYGNSGVRGKIEDVSASEKGVVSSHPGNRSNDRSSTSICRSSQSLGNIPEMSEHSERGAMHRDTNKLDRPPVRVHKRISSGELNFVGDGYESSNEFTARSTGSSIRTIKRSNRQGSFEAGRDHRHSHSSELASDGVSMVSDGPMSDDGFSSDSSWDEHDLESTSEKESLDEMKATSRSTNTPLRMGFCEMERLSERSIEDPGTSSSTLDFAE